MPGGRGKCRRSCPMCKYYKFLGNAPEKRPVPDRRFIAGEKADAKK